MLTGKVPFDSESEYELCRAQVEETPRAPRALAPEISGELEKVILRALEKDPADRFPSVHALREALQAAAPATDVAVSAPDPSSVETRFIATPQRVDVSIAEPAEPEIRPRVSLVQRLGVALPLGGLAVAALLLGAKLVRETPTPMPAAMHTPAAVVEPAKARPAPARVTPAATAAPRAPRAVASTRERELRSTPPPHAREPEREAAKSGGNGWVIHRD
jgi:serine/threonine-protein kinase